MSATGLPVCIDSAARELVKDHALMRCDTFIKELKELLNSAEKQKAAPIGEKVRQTFAVNGCVRPLGR